jgi:hypothetical protein
LPEAVGVFLVGPESLIQISGPPFRLAFLVVSFDSVNKNPRLALDTPKALGNVIQAAVEPFDEGMLDDPGLDVKGMDNSQHGTHPGANGVAAS